MTRLHSLYLLAWVTLAAIVATLFSAPISQDPAYHLFTDESALSGIPNFANVVSNTPFLVVAALGFHALYREPLTGTHPALKTLYRVFFVGVFLTAFGSGWYHLNPNNETLVWDRLPMTISFMALFCVIIGEHISAMLARRCFPFLLLAGLLSVGYWHLTETAGNGDLRPYALVQFLPMLLIPIILVLFPAALKPVSYYWGVILFYALSKLAEYLDSEIYALTGVVSGHSLKHVLAAVATFTFYLALRRRTMI